MARRRRRNGYDFGKDEDVARYRAEMRAGLARPGFLNRPFGVPLVPIPALTTWADREQERFAVEEGGAE